MIRKAKRMEATSGQKPSDIEVYQEGHKGPDPNNPDQLCSQTATDRLAAYGEEMVRRHGPDYDWRHEPVDPSVVYASGGGKAHGRYALFDGFIDSSSVRSQRTGSSSRSSCSRRPNEQELEIMRMREEMRQQREFMEACNAHNQAMYQLMQQQGMTSNFPPPPQWSQFANTPVPPPQFTTPPTHIPAPGDRVTPEAGGSGSDPAVGTGFVDSLFAFPPPGGEGGSGHSSNHPSGGYL